MALEDSETDDQPPPPPPARSTLEADDGWGAELTAHEHRRDESLTADLGDAPKAEIVPTGETAEPLSGENDGWGEEPRRRDRGGQAPAEFGSKLRYAPEAPDTDVQAPDSWAEDEAADVPHRRETEEPRPEREDRTIARADRSPGDTKDADTAQNLARAREQVDEAFADEDRRDRPRDDSSQPSTAPKDASHPDAIEAAAAAEQPDTLRFSEGATEAVHEIERERLRALPLDQAKPLLGGDNVSDVYVIERGPDKAFLKPADGETDIHVDVPQGKQWQRAVATELVDQELGFDLVPATVARHDALYGDSSLQTNAPGEAKPLVEYSDADRQAIGTLDYITGQLDRHQRNYKSQDDGRPAAIDNGFSFPEGDCDPLRSVFFPDVIDQQLGSGVLAAVRALNADRISEKLRDSGISDAAINGFRARLAEAQTGHITGAAYSGGYSTR